MRPGERPSRHPEREEAVGRWRGSGLRAHRSGDWQTRQASHGGGAGATAARSAFARALALRPKVLLLDEVTSALDPELVGEVLGVLRQLARDTTISMLIVTHEMSFARDVSHRGLFLEEGRILEEGPPDEIFTQPRNERTQQFLRAVLEH
jgi:polar amino acid transport system ATP-binding protein